MVLVPVSCCVRDGFDRQVCVNVPPLAQAVEGSGVQPPGQMQIELVVSVPVAGWVREELLRQVCVNEVPSQTVAGAGSQPPVQVQPELVVSVPVAVWVRAGVATQLCVNVVPLQTVLTSGVQAPPTHVVGGVVTQVALGSVPMAVWVLPSHEFVWVYEVASQIVEGSGPQCVERAAKHAGLPQETPSITSPVASGGHMSLHSHASVAHGQPPPGASSIHKSPHRFVRSPGGGAAAAYRARCVVSDSNRNRHASAISGGVVSGDSVDRQIGMKLPIRVRKKMGRALYPATT